MGLYPYWISSVPEGLDGATCEDEADVEDDPVHYGEDNGCVDDEDKLFINSSVCQAEIEEHDGQPDQRRVPKVKKVAEEKVPQRNDAVVVAEVPEMTVVVGLSADAYHDQVCYRHWRAGKD